METFVAITGLKAFDDALSYLRDKSAKRIGRACVRKMASVVAKRVRPFVPRQLRPNSYGAGIGSRSIRGAVRAKAGIGVGRAGKGLVVIQRGHGSDRTRVVLSRNGDLLGRRSTKFRRFTRTGHRGVGITANNLHWFALGTRDRYTGAMTRRRGNAVSTKKTGHRRRFTGRIKKEKFGMFVRRGAAAARGEALGEAARLANRLIAAEVRSLGSGGGGGAALVELGIDD